MVWLATIRDAGRYSCVKRKKMARFEREPPSKWRVVHTRSDRSSDMSSVAAAVHRARLPTEPTTFKMAFVHVAVRRFPHLNFSFPSKLVAGKFSFSNVQRNLPPPLPPIYLDRASPPPTQVPLRAKPEIDERRVSWCSPIVRNLTRCERRGEGGGRRVEEEEEEERDRSCSRRLGGGCKRCRGIKW